MTASLFPEIETSTRCKSKDGERQAQRELMAAKRAASREISIPAVRDPERRASCEQNLEQFCLIYFGPLFYLAFCALHREIVKHLQETILHSGRVAIAVPRGFGKTTLTLVAIIWAIVYGHRKYIVLICATKEESYERLDQIKEMIEDSETYPELTEDFPEACIPAQALDGATQRANQQTVDGKRTRLVWRDKRIRFAKLPDAPCARTIVTTRSTDAAIRGLVRGDLRPDLVLEDDPQTDESARSPVQSYNRDQVLTKGVEGLKGPGKALAIVALWTVIQKGDLADQYTSDLKASYRSIRRMAMPSMPKDKELIDEYIARRQEAQKRGDYKARSAHAWYIRHQKQIEDGAVVEWVENFVSSDVGDAAMDAAQDNDAWSWAKNRYKLDGKNKLRQEEVSAIQNCLNFIADNGLDVFLSEYQNDPRDPFEGEIEQLEAYVIAQRLTRLDRGVVPADADTLAGMIDCGGYEQGKGLYWGLGAFASSGFSGSIIDYGQKDVVQTKDGIEADLRATLDAVVEGIATRRFLREDGTEMHVDLLLIDAHWQATTVYDFCKENPHARILTPSMGFGLKPGALLYKSVPKGARAGDGWILKRPDNSPARVMLCRFDANRRKSFAADRLLTPMGGAGRLALFGERPEQHRFFSAQAATEKRMRIKTDDGRVFDLWSEAPDNHYWDVIVGLCTAAAVRGATLDAAGESAKKRRTGRRGKRKSASAIQAERRRRR